MEILLPSCPFSRTRVGHVMPPRIMTLHRVRQLTTQQKFGVSHESTEIPYSMYTMNSSALVRANQVSYIHMILPNIKGWAHKFPPAKQLKQIPAQTNVSLLEKGGTEDQHGKMGPKKWNKRGLKHLCRTSARLNSLAMSPSPEPSECGALARVRRPGCHTEHTQSTDTHTDTHTTHTERRGPFAG